MRNPTHVVVGICAALGLGYIAQTPTGLPEAAAGALAGLLPNIDYAFPTLRRSRVAALRRLADHNVEGGITHSALVMLPIAALLGGLLALAFGRAGMAAAVVGGVLSHLLLDAFGKTGIQLWSPLSRAWCAFPPWEKMRPHRGGLAEIAIFTLSLCLLAYLGVSRALPYAVDLARRLMGGAQ
jgi:membrane-bound metal-dependent hydrolase YbcI (DUF457 family)